MAPFKLKFRMGSSRSTSQEHDPDPQVNEALLNHHHNAAAIGASSSTIDSADCNSLASMGTNERKSLLPSKTNNIRLGYLEHRANDESSGESNTLPTTPPPSYEHVLEEKTRLSQSQQINIGDKCLVEDSQCNSIHLSSLEHISLSDSSQCTDPNCQENYRCNEDNLQRQQQSQNEQHNFNEFINSHCKNNENENCVDCEDNNDIDNRKESIDSTELLIANKMSASSNENRNSVENCPNDCEECTNRHYNVQESEACNNGSNNAGQSANNSFFDPLINHGGYCNGEPHYDDDTGEFIGQNQMPTDYDEKRCDSDSDDGWDAHHQLSNAHNLSQQQAVAYGSNSTQERALTPEIISNKSSKEIYKDLAKQWGITCKMSDTCRCMECQSHYFDCEFDENEHQKTDGGLGAGTPMFISEVMHGSACSIL